MGLADAIASGDSPSLASAARRRRPAPAPSYPDAITRATQNAASSASSSTPAVPTTVPAANNTQRTTPSLSAYPSSTTSSPLDRLTALSESGVESASPLAELVAEGQAAVQKAIGLATGDDTRLAANTEPPKPEPSPQAQFRRLLKQPYPGLDPSQSNVLNTVLSTGLANDATRKELLAATETGLVESNLANLNYGDLDSLGWRQERTSIYGPTAPTDVQGAAERFFEESISDTGGSRGKGMSAGELAQTIQGSAFPERYDEQKAVAVPLLNEFLQRADQAGIDAPGDVRMPKPISVDELFYDPGTNLADNQPTAAIGGHDTHVHYGTENQRDLLRAARIAQNMGIDIRENPLFEPVDPVHTGGSMHYDEEPLKRNLRDEARELGATGNVIGSAMDLNGTPEQLMEFDQRIASLAGAPLSAAGSTGYAPSGGTAAPAAGPGVSPLEAINAEGGGRVALEQKPAIGVTPIQNPLSARAALPEGYAGASTDGTALSALQALLSGDVPEDDSALAGLLDALIPKRRT